MAPASINPNFKYIKDHRTKGTRCYIIYSIICYSSFSYGSSSATAADQISHWCLSGLLVYIYIVVSINTTNFSLKSICLTHNAFVIYIIYVEKIENSLSECTLRKVRAREMCGVTRDDDAYEFIRSTNITWHKGHHSSISIIRHTHTHTYRSQSGYLRIDFWPNAKLNSTKAILEVASARSKAKVSCSIYTLQQTIKKLFSCDKFLSWYKCIYVCIGMYKNLLLSFIIYTKSLKHLICQHIFIYMRAVENVLF